VQPFLHSAEGARQTNQLTDTRRESTVTIGRIDAWYASASAISSFLSLKMKARLLSWMLSWMSGNCLATLRQLLYGSVEIEKKFNFGEVSARSSESHWRYWHLASLLKTARDRASYRADLKIRFLSHWDPYAVISLGAFAYSSYYNNAVEWFWWDWSLSQWPSGFLQCFDAVGWVIWPVKIVPEMTYKVSSGTLSSTHSLTELKFKIITVPTWLNYDRDVSGVNKSSAIADIAPVFLVNSDHVTKMATITLNRP